MNFGSIFSNKWMTKIVELIWPLLLPIVQPLLVINFKISILTADVTTTIVDVSDLRLTGLIIGQQYKVTGQAFLECINGTDVDFLVYNGGLQIARARMANNETTIDHSNIVGVNSPVFTATTTTVTVNVTRGTGSKVHGNSTFGETWLMYEKVPNHVEI